MEPIEKKTVSEILIETKKWCADCKTSKTPLWRAGPAGPKSLCNACGIRYRKKGNSSVLGVINGPEKKKEKPSTSSSSGGSGNLGADLGVRLIALGLGKEVVRLQRLKSPMKRQRTSRKLGEEEQAAVLLMALSCGSVFA